MLLLLYQSYDTYSGLQGQLIQQNSTEGARRNCPLMILQGDCLASLRGRNDLRINPGCQSQWRSESRAGYRQWKSDSMEEDDHKSMLDNSRLKNKPYPSQTPLVPQRVLQTKTLDQIARTRLEL